MNRSEKLSRLATLFQALAADHEGGPAGEIARQAQERVARLDRGQSAPRPRRGSKALGPPVGPDDEMVGLEAIVADFRPVALIKSGVFEPLSSPWTHLNAAAARRRIQATFASIGRVELPEMPWTYGGTGFVVGPDLVMTNRHVARQFCDGLGAGRGRLSFRPGEAALDFKREVDTKEDDDHSVFQVRDVVMIHPYWDMALLRVDGLAADHPTLTLATREPESLAGTEIVVIGYPARDDVRNDPVVQDRVFKGIYNVKRLQPGKIRGRERVKSFGNLVLAVTHDSSTLGGNSGSAVIDPSTGEVLALHFGGVYLKANYGVPAYDLARDPRVVGAGVRFRGRVAPTHDYDAAWAAAEAKVLVSGGGAIPSTRPPEAPAVSAAPIATFSIPLQISVTLGAVTQTALVTPGAPDTSPEAESARGQVPILHPDLRSRTGYQPGFLDLPGGETVPLPALTKKGAAVAAKLEDGSTEIKYHRFSVVVHKQRRLALFTAANVDWRASMRAPGGKKPSRRELTGIPDNVREQWVTDPRLPDDHQLPDVFYSKDGNAFDKGHIVRRDDVCWGETFDEIQKGNGDTFHTTNCSPQVQGFNQALKGVDNWGDLEILIEKETRAEKVIVFAGPILAADDPHFNGRDLRGPVSLQIPRSFWKIIVAATDGKAKAYGFVLTQSLSSVPLAEEFSVPLAWARHMKSIADIEKSLFGLAKLPWLKAHDAFATASGKRIAELAKKGPVPEG